MKDEESRFENMFDNDFQISQKSFEFLWKSFYEAPDFERLTKSFVEKPKEDFLSNLKNLQDGMLEAQIPESEFLDIFITQHSKNDQKAISEIKTRLLALCEKVEIRKRSSSPQLNQLREAFHKYHSDIIEIDRLRTKISRLGNLQYVQKYKSLFGRIKELIREWEDTVRTRVDKFTENEWVNQFFDENDDFVPDENQLEKCKDILGLFVSNVKKVEKIINYLPRISKVEREVKNIDRNFNLLKRVPNAAWNLKSRFELLNKAGISAEEWADLKFMQAFEKLGCNPLCKVSDIAKLIGCKSKSTNGQVKAVKRAKIFKPHGVDGVDYNSMEATEGHVKDHIADHVGQVIYNYKKGTEFNSAEVIRAYLNYKEPNALNAGLRRLEEVQRMFRPNLVTDSDE